MAEIPQTMQALRLHPDGTLHHETVPVPVLSGKQLLIHVSATAITRSELTWDETIARKFPIPGHDVSGTVVSAPSTSAFKAGDEVFALLAFDRDGAAAEYVIAVEEELCLKPKNVSHTGAAAIPLSALSAWTAIFDHGNMKAGQRLLVTAATGGVGVMGVQLGKQGNASVIGTCSEKNADFVKALGADHVVAYENGGFDDWAAEVMQDREKNGVDVILDCIGGQTLRKSIGLTRRGGRVISIAQPINEDWEEVKDRAGDDVSTNFFVVKPSGDSLTVIRRFVQEESVKPIVDRIMNLKQGQEAFDILERGHSKGKIILQL